MRAVIQRVRRAAVSVGEKETGAIGPGVLVFLGITHEDGEEDISWLTRKIINLRIFPDEAGVMNRSLLDIGGDMLVVSQFTLHAATRKGNRPSYIQAAKPEIAVPLYEEFLRQAEASLGRKVSRGIFGADMQVNLLNDGPVTIWIDTRNRE